LLHLFGAGEALFRTGWFIESITTQVLVVFAIRTRRQFFRSRPHKFLIAMALGAVAVAIVIPFLPIGRWFGFVEPPPLFFVYLMVATATYLAVVEITKSLFYRAITGRQPRPAVDTVR
jgi:Mg2+-importing ATPase